MLRNGEFQGFRRRLWSVSISPSTLRRISVSPARRLTIASQGFQLSNQYEHRREIHSSYPSPNPAHWSLSSFLEYAENASLSSSSTVYVGTHYEYTCLEAMGRLGFRLSRVGGRADAGIDLLGTWSLPSLPLPLDQPLRCIVQCKAVSQQRRSSAPGPNLVRELEGSFVGAPVGWRSDDTVGVLCCAREGSNGLRHAMRRSRRALVWILIEEGGERGSGRVRQILWNERVAVLGAEGIGVGIRYPSNSEKTGIGEAILLWNDKHWEPDFSRGEEEEVKSKTKDG